MEAMEDMKLLIFEDFMIFEKQEPSMFFMFSM